MTAADNLWSHGNCLQYHLSMYGCSTHTTEPHLYHVWSGRENDAWNMHGRMHTTGRSVHVYVYMYLCVNLPFHEHVQSNINPMDMWQSRVEIEGYSVAYFDRIAAFEAPYR